MSLRNPAARHRANEQAGLRGDLGLTEYVVFYNTERTHPSLGYNTPDEVYRTARGGGARIVDKFSEKKLTPK